MSSAIGKSQQQKQKLLVGIVLVGLMAWYFTKSPSTDIVAAKAAYENSVRQMRAVSNKDSQNPLVSPIAPMPRSNSESKLSGAAIEKLQQEQNTASPQPSAGSKVADVKEKSSQQEIIASSPERLNSNLNNDLQKIDAPAQKLASIPALELSHQECDLKEFKQSRSAESEISEDEWNCALTKIHNYTHIVRSGESISSISAQEFGSIDYWPKIWSLNPEIGNPHDLKVGQKLKFSDSK